MRSVGTTTLAFDSSTLNGDAGGALIDSGTTELLLPSSVLGTGVSDTGTLLYYLYEGFSGSSGLKETLKQWLQGSISVDSTIFSSFQSGLPTVSLDLGGAYTLALTADELALGYASGGTDYYEFAVSSGDDSIIGNVALGGKILVFDQDNYEVGIGTGTNCGAKVSNLGVNFTTHSGSGSGDDDESSRPQW